MGRETDIRAVGPLRNPVRGEAVAEDEAISIDPGQTVMEIPSRLVPAVRALIAKHEEVA